MQENIKPVTVKKTVRMAFRTEPIWQYDIGHELVFDGFELPTAFEVHFSRSPMGQSITQIGTENKVTLPDMYAQSAGTIYAWLYIAGEDTGLTKYSIEIPVNRRARITDQQPTPVEQSAIDQAIAALNAGVDAAEAAQGAAETAQGKAEQAQAGAEAAEDGAEAAKLAAQGFASAADGSATEAGQSATAAAGSAATASTKAGEADASATAAAQTKAAIDDEVTGFQAQLTDVLSSLNILEGKTSALLESKTVVGSAVSFADGCAIPAENVTLKIVPGQSGSGDPSPINIRSIIGYTNADVYVGSQEGIADDTHQIDWETEAGIIYHGDVNLTSGTIKSDWVLRDISTFSDIVAPSGQTEPWNHRFRIRNWVTGVGYDKVGGTTNFISDVLKIGDAKSNYLMLGENSASIYIYDNTISTVDEFKTKYAGHYIAYEIAPALQSTYQISPEEVMLLSGENHVWTSEGELSVTYTASRIDNEIIRLDNEIDVISDRVDEVFNKVETFKDYGAFVNGSLANGVVNTNYKYRIASSAIMQFDRELTLNIETGFRIGVHTFVNGVYSSDSGWKTGNYTIPVNTSFRIVIARVAENTSETADIDTFVSKVTFDSTIGDIYKSIDVLKDGNLFAFSDAVPGYINASGGISNQTSAKEYTSDFIPAISGDLFTLQLWATPASGAKLLLRFGAYDSNKSFVSRNAIEASANATYGIYKYTAPANTAYIRVTTTFYSDGRAYLSKSNVAVPFTYPWKDIATVKETSKINEDIAVLTNQVSASSGLFNKLLAPMKIRFCAHRGASSVAPENTIPAFEIAAERGNWAIETDVYETTDGYFVLMHDNDVSRMTDGTGNITSMTYAETQALTIDAGANIGQYPNLKIPRLEDYLMICKKYGVVPIIEVKDITHLDNFIEVVRGLGMEGGSVLTYYRDATMTHNFRLLTAMPILLVALPSTTTIDSMIAMADGYTDIWFSLEQGLVNAANVKRCHLLNIPVGGWTYNSDSDILSAIDDGVDFFFSDNKYQMPES